MTPKPAASSTNASPKVVVGRATTPSLLVPIPGGAKAEPPADTNPISAFIELQIEARKCATLDALKFAMTNSVQRLARFQTSFLVEWGGVGRWKVSRASNVSDVDPNSPSIRALADWISTAEIDSQLRRADPFQCDLSLDRDEKDEKQRPTLQGNALVLPIKARDGSVLAVLILIRSYTWQAQHMALLLPLAEAYGHAWEALGGGRASKHSQTRRFVSKRHMAFAAGIIIAGVAFVPVPMSVLAPSEVIAVRPTIVAAPMDGVISDVLVPPGTWVGRGTPVLKFVDVKVRNEFDVALRQVAVAEARYFRNIQSATATQRDQQELATSKAELEVSKATLEYAKALLARTELRAERDGLLIYTSRADWVGKPVVTGDRIMEIADPNEIEIRIDLPVSDALVLSEGNKVALFLDGDPLRSVFGRIQRTSYRPQLSTEQQLVYRVSATFDDKVARRIGLRGVARVSGETVGLWLFLLRRPLSMLRQRVGF